MSCILRARGVSFAVDEFLAGSALEPMATFRRGEPRSPASFHWTSESKNAMLQPNRSVFHRTSCALSVILASGFSSHCTLAKSPTPQLLVSRITGHVT
jgi:hypothetical protein